jgi:hypothetical protein
VAPDGAIDLSWLQGAGTVVDPSQAVAGQWSAPEVDASGDVLDNNADQGRASLGTSTNEPYVLYARAPSSAVRVRHCAVERRRSDAHGLLHDTPQIYTQGNDIYVPRP